MIKHQLNPDKVGNTNKIEEKKEEGTFAISHMSNIFFLTSFFLALENLFLFCFEKQKNDDLHWYILCRRNL